MMPIFLVYMLRRGHQQQWGGLEEAAVCAFRLSLGHCSSGPEQEGPKTDPTGGGVCHGAWSGLVDL